MPSNTFEKLAQEKKQRIFNSIHTELQRVPFPEMSINQIIKNAGIPRGSFYQYFKNKDDAFDFFISESSRKIKECIINRVSSMHGDIFEIAERTFEEMAKTGTEQYNIEFMHHIMPYVDIKKLDPFSNYVANMDSEKKLLLCSSLGIGKLNIKSEEELTDILGIIEALIQNSIAPILSGAEDAEVIKERFRRRLEIIKRATVREDV